MLVIKQTKVAAVKFATRGRNGMYVLAKLDLSWEKIK